jgi:multiple sugar transport system substrate-binding protein
MKKMWLACLILAIIAVAGCANAANNGNQGGQDQGSRQNNTEAETEAEADAAPKEVKLRFSIWGKDQHKQMYEEMLAEYKKLKPHVSVEIITIPSTDYLQKISIMNASGTAPDVAWLSEAHIPQFMANDQLVDLSELKTDADYKFDEIYPSTLELLTRGDKLYGIPFSTPPMMMYYNKKLFQDKGLKTPTELYDEGNWTYEQLLKAAQAISDPDQGVYGVNFIRNGWANWDSSLMTVLRAHGAELLSEDGTAFTLNSPEGKQALEFYFDAIFTHEIHPKPGDQTTFESGKIGIQQELYSYMGKARAIEDFEWDIVPLPEGPQGRGTTLGFAGYSIIKGTEHPEEAFELLKFLTGPDNAVTASQFFVPSRRSILESEEFAAGAPSVDSMRIAILEQMDQAEYLPNHKNWQQINTAVQTLLDYAYTQNATVDELLSRMEKDVSPLLK